MSARDKFHNAVKQGLEKEGWIITHDPLRIEYGEEDKISIDLGAEQLLGAEKAEQKIAVEVKSFLSDSAIFDFHLALGQFLNYRLVLEETEPERRLYLAVPIEAYDSFFYRDLPKASIKKYQLKLIIYDSRNEVIVKWIN
ncbi:XisH family protein [Nostoc sp. FACHB-152]|uniref:XisH family protein n=1 Tax=unclassified Nostoc TaxID=2593658 RepID=UPI00168909C2|nr:MULTISPECIES: XisH family protein [unclassified Nostoc]MBD2446934.1 XisH family protein [Nostoc sp. FACHB-152]MBD2467728.1 XisH family protein [Nostoc sp. FACHB-145]